MSSLWTNDPCLPEMADGGVPSRRLRATAPEQAAQLRHCSPGGFFSIFATGRDYVLEEGPPDYGRAIGGNILTPLRRVE